MSKMVCNVVLITCLFFASTFASPTAEQNVVKVPEFLSHLDNAKSGLEPRIIGGDEVTANKYPFQAILMIYKGATIYLCGGTLYSNQFVLTAAQCVDMHPDYILVGLGAHNISNQNSIELVLNTSKYVHHNNWDANTDQNDIALVQLPKKVTFTNHIKAVEIAEGSDTYAGANGTSLGWGQTEHVGLSYVLREVETAIMSNEECKAINDTEYQQLIKSVHLCTSGEGTVGICSSDIGGPLLVDGVQVGIISHEPKNCIGGLPSVYTRVTEYHDWIVEHAVAGASARDGIQLATMVAVALCLLRFFK